MEKLPFFPRAAAQTSWTGHSNEYLFERKLNSGLEYLNIPTTALLPSQSKLFKQWLLSDYVLSMFLQERAS